MTLRLADAILLGDSLKRSTPKSWLNSDGSCGCAFGGALLAAGVSARAFWEDLSRAPVAVFATPDRVVELECVKSLWPWLSGDNLREISRLYFDIGDGTTIEEIAAYADSIDPTPRVEPPVQEPSQVEVRQESTVSHD